MTHLTQNYYCINLPEDAYDLYMVTPAQLNYFKKDCGLIWEDSVQLPPGEYRYLFMSKDVTEEQAKGVVERKICTGKYSVYGYKDYTALENGYEFDLPDALESFHSLLTSKQVKGNCAVLELITKK